MRVTIDNVDLPLLKSQSNILHSMLESRPLSIRMNKEEKGVLIAMINFIDHIADVAEGIIENRKAAKSNIGLRCSICGDLQFNTPSGVICGNGHGGAEPMEE